MRGRRTFSTATAMLPDHVASSGSTFDSRIRTTCQRGTSYRPSTKDTRNSASSTAASTMSHSRARRSAAVFGVCFSIGVLLSQTGILYLFYIVILRCATRFVRYCRIFVR